LRSVEVLARSVDACLARRPIPAICNPISVILPFLYPSSMGRSCVQIRPAISVGRLINPLTNPGLFG
jgi:hypothetical protein